MADETQDVGGIGVGLNLDTAGWSAGVARAKAELRGLIESASNVTIMAPRLTGRGRGTLQGEAAALAPRVTPLFSVSRDSIRDMRTRMNAMLREHSLQGQTVSVPIKLARIQYGALRSEISQGIGEVPVRIKVITETTKSDLAAVIASSTGGTIDTANQTITRARARTGIQRRATGGPVEPHGTYMVGERGPEVLRMRGTGGMVYPHRDEGTPRHSGSEHLTGQQLNYLGNLRAIAKRMQPEIIKAGRDWYPMAGSFGRRIAEETGTAHEQAIGVLTALSAGTAWNSNKTKYGTAMRQMATPGMFHETEFPYGKGLDAHRKAIAIMAGVDPKKAFGTSPKVGQFYGGVMGDLKTLTLDRWAFRTTTQNGTDQLNGRERARAERAWRKVAQEHGLEPAEFQAALWLQQQIETPAKLGSSRAVKPAPGQGGMGFEGGGFVHASEHSALSRLRDITDRSGRILPGYTDEAQSINLQVERMRMASRSPVIPQWAQRMHAGEGAPKEFGGTSGEWGRRRGTPRFTMQNGFAVARDRAAEGRSYRAWLRQSKQPRDSGGRYMSPYSQDAWYEREGYNDPSFINLIDREPYPTRMSSEAEGQWMHRWSGGRAAAYAQTMANEGGTFDPSGQQPSKGYAVATGSGTFARVGAEDKLGFIRAFRSVQKLGSPYVGTWLHEGQIDVDPAMVAKTNREANQIARAKAQIAYFNLGNFTEIQTQRRRKDPAPGQVPLGLIDDRYMKAKGGPADYGYTPGGEQDPWRQRRARADAFERDRMPGSARPKQDWSDYTTDPSSRHYQGPKASSWKSAWEHDREQREASAPVGGIIAKLEAMAGQTTQSPMEAEVARLKLIGLRNRGRDGGGSVFRGGLDIPSRFDALVQSSQHLADQINAIRGGTKERSLVFDPTTGAKLYGSTGDDRSVDLPAFPGKVDFHNHPLQQHMGQDFPHRSVGRYYDMPRPSNNDVFLSLSHGARESWVVTPEQESIVRPGPGSRDQWLGTQRSISNFNQLWTDAAKRTRFPMSMSNNWSYLHANPGRYDDMMASLGEQAGFGYERRPRSTPGEIGYPDEADRLRQLAEAEQLRQAQELERLRKAQQRQERLQKTQPGANPDQMSFFAHGGHGDAAGQPYVVGEIGPELFVPDRMRGAIPADVFGQLPKRQQGGITEIGRGGEQVWQAPEDGWIIPNRLMNKVPRRQAGTRGPGGQFLPGNPYRRTGVAGQQGFGGLLQPAPAATPPPPVAPPQPVTPPPPRAAPSAPTAGVGTMAALAAVADVLGQRTRPVRRPAGTDPFAESMRRELRGEGQLIPARTPRMAAGAIAAQLLGRRSFQQRQYDAEIALRDATKATRQYETAVSNQRAAIYDFTKVQKVVAQAYQQGVPAGTFDKEVQARRDFLDARKKQTQLARTELEGARGRATTAAKAAEPTPAGIARNILAFAGGQFAFQLAFKGLATAEEAVLPPLRKVWDQFAGFEPTLTRVSTALGDATTQLSGNAKMAVANAAAQAGLSGSSYEYLKANLELAGGVKAGTTSLEQAGDLYKANIAIQQGGAPQGLYGGYGGLMGSAFLAQQLGGGKGYAETLSGNIGATLGGQGGDATKNVPSGIEFLTNPTFRNYVSGQEKKQGGGLLSGATDAAGIIGDIFNDPSTIFHLGENLANRQQPGAGFQQPETRYNQTQRDAASAQMNDFNESLKRGSAASGIATKGSLDWAHSQEEVDQATRTAIQSGNIYGLELAQQGIVLRDATGAIEANAQAATKAYEAASRGQAIPSQAAFLAQQGQALMAQAQGAAVAGARERTLSIPGQLGLQLAANPLLPASAGLPVGYKSGLNTGTQQMQDKLTADGQAAVRGLTADIAKQLGPAAAQEFTGYTNTISTYGSQIAKLNTVLANRQAALSAAEYGNSLRIINRSISDAQGLVSGAGATTGPNANLGAVQRKQFQLSQQSNIYATQLAQKQINFQTASAGFLVQGATPEERAARQREAQVEARYSQRQLNIQKAQIPLAQTAFDVGAQRQLTDLKAQRGVMAEQRKLDLEQIDIAKRIAADQLLIEQATAKSGSLINQAGGVFSQALGVAVSGAAQGIGSFTDLLIAAEKKLADAYGLTLTTKPIAPGPPPGTKPNAAGWLGDVRSSTNMTIGEAGHEKVAILRNPRAATLGSPTGGGGNHVTITITGNTFRDDRDIETVARRVEDAVIRSLGRRASIQGLRSP